MTNHELTTSVGARFKNRKLIVRPEFTAWARAHKAVLRYAMAHPRELVNLADSESDDVLRALNFDHVTVAPGDRRWIHPLGDDAGNRLILQDRTTALAEAVLVKQHSEREYRLIAFGRKF